MIQLLNPKISHTLGININSHKYDQVVPAKFQLCRFFKDYPAMLAPPGIIASPLSGRNMPKIARAMWGIKKLSALNFFQGHMFF